jgi:hypothetical protein
MKTPELLVRCKRIIEDAGYTDEEVSVANFLDYSDFVRDIIKDWPKKKKAAKWVKPFVEQLAKLRGELAQIVEADPMVLYKPAHPEALKFHQSGALIRYYRAPNRTAKTQTAVADNYWVVTGQHPYRPRPPLPAAVGVVGVNFSKYCPKVFESKYVYGEGGNPLSPIFPDGGKWFARYDKLKHIIEIACPACAEAGKAGSCKHPKSSIILFSDVEGCIVLAGGQYSQLQFDEQVQEAFLGEGLKRLETVPNSGMMVTETPLGGKGFWTHKILTKNAKARKKVEGSNQLMVELFTIDQYSAGLTDPARIDASKELMSPAEAEARIYGRPAAYSATGVFDSWEISNMMQHIATPARGYLVLPNEHLVEHGRRARDLLYFANEETGSKIEMFDDPSAALRVWSEPVPGVQYVIGGDVAQGLTRGDPSCASVLRMDLEGGVLHFTLVSQLHGWLNPRNYAEEAVKLALWYNNATLVIERKGPGDEAIRSVKDWGYWGLFRDVTDQTQVEFHADPGFGIDTNVRSKAVMVSILQQVVKDRTTGERTIDIHCEDTLEELGTFGQQMTEKGNVTFRGESGMHDDRVMSLVMATYAAIAFQIFDFKLDMQQKAEKRNNLTSDEQEVWRGLKEQIREQQQEGEW